MAETDLQQNELAIDLKCEWKINSEMCTLVISL